MMETDSGWKRVSLSSNPSDRVAGRIKRRPWSIRLALLVSASIALLLVTCGIATWNLRAQRIEGEWVAHSNRVRYELVSILQLLVDAQTGARGFALGSDRALRAYTNANPLIAPAIAHLNELVADNPKQRPLVAQLAATARDLNASNLTLVAEARNSSRDQLRALIGEGHTEETMASARILISQMQAEEDHLVVERRATRDRARAYATFALWGTGGLGAMLLVLMVYFTRRDEANMHRAERELATTLRSIGDAVIATDVNGAIRYMNPIAEMLTGWNEGDAQGLPLARVYNILGEESRIPVDSPATLVLQEGKTVQLANHTMLIARDGRERAIADSGAPIVDEAGEVQGMVLVFRDVSESRSTQRLLQMRETELRIINEYARFPVAHCDTRHRFLFVNKAYAERLGLTPEECVGKHAREVVGAAAYESVLPQIQLALRGQIAEFETEIPYGGTYGSRWMHCIYAPVLERDGSVGSFVAAVTDITARISAERELRHSQEALQQADRRKDAFIATLSHELRNPLAPIRNAARIIAAPNLTPADLLSARSIIERQVAHMALLLDDLLDIARITQGKLHLKKDSVALLQVVDAAVEVARPLLDVKSHNLTVSLPEHPVMLEADQLRLAQILSNLLTNAAKYSDPGSAIELNAVVEGDSTLSLTIRDSGIGIDPASLARIFEMFSQVEGVKGRSDGGLGIGLALVKGLTELHGGTITAHSAGLGRGSEFRVRLPVLSRHQLAMPLVDEANQAPPTSRARILVADDNRDSAESLAMFLELSGHDVRIAHHGRAAIALAHAFRPEFAVLDIGMPDLSGYEVAQELRREEWGHELQLIALTGWGQERDRQLAMEAGFDYHLIKPVDPDQLEALISANTRKNL